MKVNYDLKKEDYIEFNLHHMGKSKTIKRTLFIEQYLIPLIFIITPFVFAKNHSNPPPIMYFMIPCVIMYILWTIFFPKYFRYSFKKRIEKLLNEGKNSTMFGPQTLSITDKGIFEFSEMEKSKVDMKAVERVDVTENYIYIYINAVNAYIIPSRAFKTLNEKYELIDLLKKHCKVCIE